MINISTSALAKKNGIDGKYLFNKFKSLGWIDRKNEEWILTELGKQNGGQVHYDSKLAKDYIVWPENILENETDETTTDGFRDKFRPTEYRTFDGHYVRSKSEMIIDNYLYRNNIAHAYERRLPVEEEIYSDFYIPSRNVYIEYWGLKDEPKYTERKKFKQEIYKKYNFNLIELTDDDIKNLDDILPQKLLKFGVTIYCNC